MRLQLFYIHFYEIKLGSEGVLVFINRAQLTSYTQQIQITTTSLFIFSYCIKVLFFLGCKYIIVLKMWGVCKILNLSNIFLVVIYVLIYLNAIDRLLIFDIEHSKAIESK